MPEVDDAQCHKINHFLVHSIDPTDARQVTVLSYNVDMTKLSPSATANSGSQLAKQTQKVFAATTSHYIQSGHI